MARQSKTTSQPSKKSTIAESLDRSILIDRLSSDGPELGSSSRKKSRIVQQPVKQPEPALPDVPASGLVKISFIPNEEFASRSKAAEFLAPTPPSKSRVSRVQLPEGLPPYLASLYQTPLLTPEQEIHLFRKFNYLKYLAATTQGTIHLKRPSRAKQQQVADWLGQAEFVRNQIVQANLRLVVANARHFADGDHSFDDLVSDGNFSLVQAVEKFDFSRGFRFSTYATHAIRRTYFRRMTRRQREKTRLHFADSEVLQEAPEPEGNEFVNQRQLDLYNGLLDRMGTCLNERELLILKARFSLNMGGEEAPTLQVLAAELGICKERVRQLQNRAIDKVRVLALEIQKELGQPLDLFDE
jgi:RNA polymerase primary sigma factor